MLKKFKNLVDFLGKVVLTTFFFNDGSFNIFENRLPNLMAH